MDWYIITGKRKKYSPAQMIYKNGVILGYCL